MSSYSDDTSYYLDMCQRKSAVDPTIKIWKERADKRWKEKDDKWEEEYDARIVEDERKAKEEKERWEKMTEEEKEAKMKAWDMFTDCDYSDDSDSDSDSSEDEDIDPRSVDWNYDVITKELTPEEKKIEERKDYDEQMKEMRTKRYHEVWDEMLRCSWPQLRAYRHQFGLDNEHFNADTFL